MAGIVNVGPAPPTILRISDGGHIENFGLLPLLQLRLPKIVVVNGGFHPDYGVELLYALQMAREKLRCSFTGIDGRDVIEDVRANFVEKKPGEQPRSYKYVSSTTFHPSLPYCRDLKSSLYGRGTLDSKLLLKFIKYFQEYLTALSRTLYAFLRTTSLETGVFSDQLEWKKRSTSKGSPFVPHRLNQTFWPNVKR